MVLRLDVGPGVETGLIERVQREVEAMAAKSGLVVMTGASNLVDTAAVAGCTAKVVADCRDPIMETLDVDELVYGTVERSMSGNRVSVARARRNQPPHEVTLELPAGDLDRAVKATHPGLDGLFPAPGAELVAGSGTKVIGATETGGATAVGPDPGPGGGTTVGTATGPGQGATIEASAEGRRPLIPEKVLLGGIIGGGALAVTGVLLWVKAGAMQSDIDGAPVSTPEEIDDLRDLEDRAASYARWGNGLVVVGVAVGGAVGVYWLVKGRSRAPARTAITPWVAPGAGGFAVAWRLP
jgi:hypothetical protein